MTAEGPGPVALDRRPSRLLVLGISGALVAAGGTAYFVTEHARSADAAGPAVTEQAGPTVAAESTDVDAPEKAATVAVPAARGAYDQLTADEVAFARNLVAQHPSYAGTESVTDEAGAQYLSADLADPAMYDDLHRRLSLMYYDYGSEELLHYVVDLSGQSVETVTAAQDVQPAPTEFETQTAFELLLASDVAGEAILQEFTETTGETTLTEDTVDVTAHSFSGGALGSGVDACATDRCVEVLVQTADGPFLTTTPYVVNLSTQTVTPVD
ncbi:hypothetical protein [Georgenia faecalis]|uniref:Tat pathway signal sequence domain protein n=1 Tax=Georgenia faecalis TaxID=2483799 RepID=A0ABV9D7D9_9MICO